MRKHFASMRKCLSLTTVVSALLLLASCTAYKKVPYIQNWNDVDLSPAAKLYDAKIMPKDELAIIVNYPSDPDAVVMFNLRSSQNTGSVQANTNALLGSLAYQNYTLSYLVDNEGCINYPLLGKIKVKGMTINELENHIAGRIKGAYTVEEPIVTVRMSNFKVSVVGDVNSPGIVTASNGKLNIFEALAQRGDLTLYGVRSDVKVIRENEQGEKVIAQIDLNDANIINSPYYQLQQNDIIYVRPSNVKARGADWGNASSIVVTSLSLLMTMTSLIINIVR